MGMGGIAHQNPRPLMSAGLDGLGYSALVAALGHAHGCGFASRCNGFRDRLSRRLSGATMPVPESLSDFWDKPQIMRARA